MSDPRLYIMAVDPGKRTGLATGVFTLQESVEATLRAYADRSVRAYEVEGSYEEQAVVLFDSWVIFRRGALRSGARAVLVMEDFNLRQMAVDLAPVEVRSALRTLIVYEGYPLDEVEDQTASEAKSYATTPRLQHWGLYSLGRSPGGRDHKRDALRHLALRVSRALEGR